MMVFSTILQVKGRPTVYNVYKNGGTAFFHPVKPKPAPILMALYHADWRVMGTDDQELVQQAICEVHD